MNEEQKTQGMEKMSCAFQAINEEELEDIEEQTDNEPVVLSDKCKKAMNRIFREEAGISKIPYPEVDNAFERVRSSFVRAFLLAKQKIKRFFKGK